MNYRMLFAALAFGLLPAIVLAQDQATPPVQDQAPLVENPAPSAPLPNPEDRFTTDPLPVHPGMDGDAPSDEQQGKPLAPEETRPLFGAPPNPLENGAKDIRPQDMSVVPGKPVPPARPAAP